MLGKVVVHFGCIIILLAVLAYHWLKLLQVSFAEIVKLYLYTIEEGLCLFLDSLQGSLCYAAVKGGNVDELLALVDIVSVARGE